jgi:HK97 family phage portal protein
MSLISRFRGALAWLSVRSTPIVPRSFEEVMARIDETYGTSIGGQQVTATAALQVATVLACVKVIADGCGTPELHVYREGKDGRRELARNIPEYRLLNRRPNEWQTSLEFRRTMTLHAALTGNALAVKVMAGNRVRELIPVKPGSYQIERTGRYQVVFRVHDEFGEVGTFTEDQVLHLPNLQWEFWRGLNAVRLAASAIGLSMAAETSQAKLHENGGRPGGILSTEQKLDAAVVTRLKEMWGAFSRTARNGVAVLDGGLKYFPVAMTGVDAQHVETRRLQVEEVCRAFGVFPIMVGHSDKTSTFASSEAFFAAHTKQTLTTWHRMWAQRLDEFVLDGAGPLWVEFDTRYLLAGSMKDRAVWARTMAELGIYTRNELRDEEGRDPLPGLDEPLTPMNMGGSPAGDGPEDEPEENRPTSDRARQVRGRSAERRMLAVLASLEARLAELAARQAPGAVVELRTSEIDAAFRRIADAHLGHIKAVGDAMPITVNLPEQPAPVVHVQVEAPAVKVDVQPAGVTVVDSHPTRAVQTVERKGEDIVRTVTTYERGE